MTIPKTPRDFDYDLWTIGGRYFSRLKHTGEVTEISHEVMKFLRNEEKKLRREMDGVPTYGVKDGKSIVVTHTTMLSLNYVTAGDDMDSAWCYDKTDFESEILVGMTEQEYRKSLTERQLDVYLKCLLGNMLPAEYAKSNNISKAAVTYCIEGIRKKAKIFFE